MTRKLIHIFKGFLNFLLPQRCLGCGKQNFPLCDECVAAIPLSEVSKTDQFFGKSEFIDKIIPASSYKNEIVKKAIWLLKYRGAKILAEPLAGIIFRRIKNEISEIMPAFEQNKALIIPIPLSKKRFRERGYNQAEFLGKFLSDKMSINIKTDILYKTKETKSQVEIKDKEKRLENICGAFEIKNAETIKGKNIILIDDVVTTGATLNEAAFVLKKAGAKKIIGLTVAKG